MHDRDVNMSDDAYARETWEAAHPEGDLPDAAPVPAAGLYRLLELFQAAARSESRKAADTTLPDDYRRDAAIGARYLEYAAAAVERELRRVEGP